MYVLDLQGWRLPVRQTALPWFHVNTFIPKNVIHQHQIRLVKACVLSGHLFHAQDPCYGCAHLSGHRIQQKASLTKRSQSSSLLCSPISCCTDNSRWWPWLTLRVGPMHLCTHHVFGCKQNFNRVSWTFLFYSIFCHLQHTRMVMILMLNCLNNDMVSVSHFQKQFSASA